MEVHGDLLVLMKIDARLFREPMKGTQLYGRGGTDRQSIFNRNIP
jgi:hypothetical protein